ncbi:MAG: YbjN domain-containing protein [Elusimicrobiota bacterium]|jgi:hypothetical protein
MGKLLDTVAEFLIDDKWVFDKVEGRDIIKTGVRVKNASYRMFIDCVEVRQQVMLYVLSPDVVAPEKRLFAAEFLTRANYGLRFGNFELDMDDGEVRFKVSVDVEGSLLSTQMVRNMVAMAVLTMDRYYPGLKAVCLTDTTPKSAAEDIDKKQ